MTQIAAVIDKIKVLSSRDEDYPELLQEMHKLAALAPRSMGSICEPGTILYRATNHHIAVPSRIEEIWFPPADQVLSFNRANRPGVAVFYCCSDPNGAFREIGANLGQYAVLAQWDSTRRLVLHDVGYTFDVFARAESTRSIPERHQQFHANLSQAEREIREFFALAFTDPTSTHYRVTAAIAEMFLACDVLSGIMYPAVAKWANVDNLALLPDFVRTGLRLVGASVAFVDDVTPDGISGAIIATLKSCTNGDLAWEYEGAQPSDIPPQSSLATYIRPGEKKRITSSGQLQIDGKTYDLLPGFCIELEGSDVVVRDLQGRIVGPVS